RRLNLVKCVAWHRRSDLQRGYFGALIGDSARRLGRQPHPIDGYLVGVGIPGAVLDIDPNADAMADALGRVIDHRLFESERLRILVLEIEIGVVRLAFQGGAENALEGTFTHSEAVAKESFGVCQFLRHRVCSSWL